MRVREGRRKKKEEESGGSEGGRSSPPGGWQEPKGKTRETDGSEPTPRSDDAIGWLGLRP